MLAWLTPQLHGSAWLENLMTRKMFQMPSLEHFIRYTTPVQPPHSHNPACGQPRVCHWDSEILFKPSHYNLWPQWTLSPSHTGFTASHQQTWRKLGGMVVTCSVISITVCSFRLCRRSQRWCPGSGSAKGNRAVLCVLAQNAAQHRAALPSTQWCVWDINMRNILLHSIPVSFGYLPVMQKEQRRQFF